MAEKKSQGEMNESEQYECQFFYEDEVYRYQEKIGKTQYGIVLENSEYASSDEDSDDEAPSESHKLKKGQIRVAWYPTGKENILSERKVSLADRSLMPGDVVVRKENGREKMCGYCRQVKTVAAVRILGSDQVICNVKSEDLTPLEAFSPDIAVTLDNWVGMARTVKFKITLRTREGSLCSMDDQQAMELRQMNVKYSRNSEFHRDEFYPGQLLVGKPSHFNNAVWIEGGPEKLAYDSSGKHKKKARIVATVEKVEVVSLGVQWQCQSWAGNENLTRPSEQPKFAVEGDDLKRVKMLNVFEPCTLQLGDKSFYSFKATDPMMSVKEWNQLQKNSLFPHLLAATNPKKMNGKTSNKPPSDEWESDTSEVFEGEQTRLSETESCSSCRGSQGTGRAKPGNLTVATRSLKRRKLRKAKPKTNNESISAFVPVAPGDQMVVETLCTYSWVDVVWQDGSTETKISSRDLYPVHHLDDKEFFPGDFVLQADGNSNTSLLDYGVVQHVDAQARTAMVQWFRTSTKPDWLRPEQLERSEVSVYDLKDHPDFKFRPGSIVVRVADPCGSSSVGSAGQVLDNHVNGQVEVWWADGATSQCWPQELYRVGDYDSDAGELWDDQSGFVVEEDDEEEDMATDEDDDDDSQASWQTESEGSVDVDMEAEEKPKTPSGARFRSTQHTQRLTTNLDKARNALHRLEPLLQNVIEPGASGALQLGEILKLLLEVYKQCRYLDRLMGSSYFHEKHFEGLLEKVRDDERQEALNRLSNHLKRLFGCDASGRGEVDQTNCNLKELGRQIANFAVGTQGALARFITAAEGACQEELGANSTSTPNRPQPSTLPVVGGSADERNAQDQILQVCVRLGQLLATQLACAQEEMDRRRWPPETKETAPSSAPVLAEEKEATSLDQATTLDQATMMPVQEPLTVEPALEESLEQSFSIDDLSEVGRGIFTQLENAPAYHKYFGNISQPTDPKQFHKSLRQELNLLRTSLPRGIRVKTFEDRMDLFSVLIEGPAKTPYEGGLFLFDFQLPNDYPRSPPLCHYWSYCTERLNPNLYEEGKVCVSLLGTWSGKGSEMWGPGSNLLQVLVSIQGLILVAEPYYNEAGYERQRGSAQARENSRLYNEMVLLKMLQAMGRLGQNPPQLWRTEIMEFLQQEASSLVNRYQRWMNLSAVPSSLEGVAAAPDFPLVPASKGFCLTLNKSLQTFEMVIGHALKNWHNPSPDGSGGHGDGIPNTSLNSTEEANLSR